MPLTRCHEYESSVIEVDGVQVNVTSFDTSTIELAGLALTPIIKIFISHVCQ